MTMRWLIVEDALRDRKGHWAEYIGTFLRGLEKQGDEVVILCDRKAEEFIPKNLKAHALLPESIWHRMGDGAGTLTRYLRVPHHAIRTWWSVYNYFKKHLRDKPPDVIFVPTVLPHHLLGWYLLLKCGILPPKSTLLLFFPNLPLCIEDDGNVRWIASPTTRLMAWIVEKIRLLVESRRVVLGVETAQMQLALARLTQLPVLYLPHPVDPLPESVVTGEFPLYFAAYGVARAEKGSDLFQAAIINYLTDYPESRIRFGIQWMEAFEGGQGKLISVADTLTLSKRVDVIRSFFQEGEYSAWLLKTSALVLPYRSSSYALRVSRVVIEAMVNGLPVITTEGSTLWSQLERFGAGVSCKDEDVNSLVLAIRDMELKYQELSEAAILTKQKAREHFSVKNFRQILKSFIS
jgi:glycosyltransferase involved in cell wall biosynthesis